jgi:hypothetical protein
MQRVRVNAVVDILAFVSFVLSLISGIIPWKALPSGGGSSSGQETAHALFLWLERGEWKDLHVYASLVFAALMVLHLLLHWRWIHCIPRYFARGKAKTCPPDVVISAQDVD